MALQDNAINLTPDLLATMPDLPPIATVPRLPTHIVYHWGGKWAGVDTASLATDGHHVAAARQPSDRAGTALLPDARMGGGLVLLPDTTEASVAQTRRGRSATGSAAGAAKALPMPVQEVATVTHFMHLRLCLDMAAVPVELRPYMVLWQEVLLETDLSRPGQVRGGHTTGYSACNT